MEEKRIMVENMDEFWEKEQATFNVFMNTLYLYMDEHPKAFYDCDNGIKTCLDMYLHKGFTKEELDKHMGKLYKELEELLGEVSEAEINHEEGLYSCILTWNYPTHNYYIEFYYVYDGYEEEYYDLYFDEDDEDYEELYEDQELENHKISCGIHVYEEN